MEKKDSKNLKKRPPIVVIMGHVDHGKTTLLDYIRKTNLAAREAGGITQSIGAHEIIHNGEKITFIDTPGHEAFSNMRAHGVKAADIAILVVAAEDGVKPQTKEVIKFVKDEKIPFIVAINKIDKANADIEKTKQELMQNEVFLEGFGGDVSWSLISAKTGEGVPELLDHILLTAEVENLTYDEKDAPSGVILSVKSDPRRGILVSGILKNGALKTGQFIGTETANGKIKALENFLGKTIKSAEPCSPVLIFGFEKAPQVGEEFIASDSLTKLTAKIIPLVNKNLKKETQLKAENADEQKINLILKSEEAGSLEALRNLIKKLGAEIPLNIRSESIGNIHETDIKLALSSEAIILGFKVKIDRAAENLAEAKKAMVFTSAVIYELEKELKDYAKKVILKEIRAIEILGVFGGAKGKEKVVGGKILFGPIKNQEKFEIWHGSKMMGAGKILNLQSQRKDVLEAQTGIEVGLLAESEDPIKVGNKLLFPD